MTSFEGYSLSLPYRERAGSVTDLAVLVDMYSALLFRVAHSVLRNRHEAEDVVQDVFVRVIEHQSELPAVREMRVWLVRIAWNLALDRRRIRPEQMDEQFAMALVSRSVPADQAISEARRLKTVIDEMERLPRKERHVLLLSAVEGLDTAEMATILERSESAVRPALSRTNPAAGAAGERRSMSDPNEEMIDRVLEGLGKAEAPANFDQRILAAVLSHAKVKPPSARPRWRIAFLTACAAFAGAAYTAFVATSRVPDFLSAPQRVAATIPSGDPLQAKALARPMIAVPTPATSRAPKPASRHALAARDQLAAVSFPAPPMPLTDQEKLLLRLAHKGDPVQLAMLDPIQRNAWYVEERAEVQRFFTPSPSGENK